MGKLQSTDFYKPHFRQVQSGLSAAWPSAGAGCWNGDSVTAVLELRPVPPACFLPQTVARRAIHGVLLKIIPLPLAQFLSKCGLLTRVSPFLRASTQSLAETLRQLPASPELQAVLSYIFPTYGGYGRWAVGRSWGRRCCPPGPQSFFLNVLG